MKQKNFEMKVAKRYEEGVELHQSYIDVLLRLAGYRFSDLYTSILAHSSYHGNLDRALKIRISELNSTSLQVVSNAITKLRKEGLLIKNSVNPRLNPTSKNNINLIITLTTQVNVPKESNVNSTSSTASTSSKTKTNQPQTGSK